MGKTAVIKYQNLSSCLMSPLFFAFTALECRGVSSHGKPGKVMEIDSRFWKIKFLKSHGN